MDFLKEILDSFVPHADNEYKPHFFRMRSFLTIAVVIAVLGVGAVVVQKTLIGKSDYMAAVIASTIVDLTNTDRSANNLQYLAVSPILERAAQLKADDMAAKGYFAHTSPEGMTPWHWFKEAGYNFAYAGENLAVRFSDSVDVERAWMNSPGHRANILNSHFTEIGIGISQGTYEGQPTVFVVQLFGEPAPDWAKYPDVATTLKTAPATTTPITNGTSTATPATTTPLVAGVKTVATSTKPVAVKSASTDAADAEEFDTDTKKTGGAEHVQEDPEPAPKVLMENETFIAVKNEVATNSPLTARPTSPDSPTSFIQKLVTSPKTLVDAIYLVLSGIIVIALIVMIVVEVKKQHLKNAALGVLLIVLMVGLLYLGQMFGPGPLTIL